MMSHERQALCEADDTVAWLGTHKTVT